MLAQVKTLLRDIEPLMSRSRQQTQFEPDHITAPTPDASTDLPNAMWPPVHWGRHLFHNAETPDRSCPEVIDLTGPNRHVVFGPFIMLEAGLWRATMDVELCKDAARRHLVVQFGDEHTFSAIEMPFRRTGRQSISVNHDFKEPALAEARILLAKAAFHGSLRFFGAQIERLS